MLNKLAPYRKFVTAVVGALITWATMVVLSPPVAISAAEWISLAGGLATALGVYGIVNAKQ